MSNAKIRIILKSGADFVIDNITECTVTTRDGGISGIKWKADAGWKTNLLGASLTEIAAVLEIK